MFIRSPLLLPDPGPDVGISLPSLVLGTVFGIFSHETMSGVPHHLRIIHDQDPVRTDFAARPKAARIEGNIREAGTGQDIKHATITLHRPENSELIYRTSTEENHGKFKVPVPPVPFKVEVEAEGYERWTYGADGNQKAGTVKLNRGESRNLQIALHKKAHP